jgi:hypothetical protein
VSFSFAIRAEFGQARVVQFTSGSTIDWRAQETFVFKENAMIFEEKIQPARTIRIQTLGNYRDVILTPSAIFVQLTSVAIGIVKFEIHPDPVVGFFSNQDRVVAGRRLSVDSKDALNRTGGILTYNWQRTHGTNDATGNP